VSGSFGSFSERSLMKMNKGLLNSKEMQGVIAEVDANDDFQRGNGYIL